MDATSRDILWGQFGAAIDMLENAMRACPDELWGDRERQPEFWYRLLRQATNSAPVWIARARGISAL